MDGQVGFVLLEAGAIGFLGRPAWLGSGRHLAAWVFDRNDVNFYQKCCGPATNSKTQTVLRKLGLFHIVAGTGAERYLAIVWWWLFRSLFVQGWRPWPPTHLASVMDGLWKASFGQETLQRFHEPHRTDFEEGRWDQIARPFRSWYLSISLICWKMRSVEVDQDLKMPIMKC